MPATVTETDGADQATLARGLLSPSVYGGDIDRVDKLETHISYIFLAGPYAYKVKKRVNLGFLDFRTLRARRFYCEEELRLNRRLAPGLYLGVVAITGTADHPILAGDGVPFEYAVKMRRFPQEQLLDRLAANDALTPRHIDELAAKTAAFHSSVSVASAADSFGTAQAVKQPALDNFSPLRAALGDTGDREDLDFLNRWTLEQCEALTNIFDERKRAGCVRECHGDFHLGNIAVIDGEVTLFDCLEFNKNLRWIDVMNEVAFLYMDLQDRKKPALAQRFLNRYLELTGDYAGLVTLRFYTVYRASVRAKVHALRAQQSGSGSEQAFAARAECRGYIALAARLARRRSRAVIITHGLSGSGKTTHTQSLLELAGAVRIRSDVERKRLQGLEAPERTRSAVGRGAYAAEMTALTYRRLLTLTQVITEAGYPVIVDATFLERAHRDDFRRVADTLGVPFVIVDFVTAQDTLRERIHERQTRRDDASEADIAVLEHQLKTQEPLQQDELVLTQSYLSDRSAAQHEAAAPWASTLRRIGLSAD